MLSKPYFWVILGVITLAGLVSAFGYARHHMPAFAYARHHGGWVSPEKKADWLVEITAKELNLSADQKTKLNGIKDEILTKMQGFKGMREGVRDEILSQIKNQNVDQVKLNQLFGEKEAQFKEMRTFLIAKFTEFHDLLTPEQRTKLVEELDKFHKRNHE
jgi:Spy/CpxP family protein refolding chaperone